MLLTRSYHSADCDSNRSLTCCKIKPPPEKLHCFKHLGKPRTDENIIQHLEKQCNTASRSWNHLHEAIQKSALATFGRRTSKNCDWFEAKSEKLIPVIVTKRASVAENKRSPIEKTLQGIRSARSKVQQRARRWGNEYWREISNDIQTAAAAGILRGIYEGIKKILDQSRAKQHP